MKKIIMILSLVTIFNTNAFAEDARYQTCTPSDRSTLKAATVRGNTALLNLVKEDTIANEVSCMVKKPRFVHLAVCGTNIIQIDTYIVNTKTEATYEIVVDSSYRSCLRMRIIPMIKSLKYEPTLRVIPFSN